MKTFQKASFYTLATLKAKKQNNETDDKKLATDNFAT